MNAFFWNRRFRPMLRRNSSIWSTNSTRVWDAKIALLIHKFWSLVKQKEGILPKFQQSLNFFATTSYDEVDETKTERIWMLRLLKMLQKVKNAEFLWNSYDKFLLRYRNCVASSANNKVIYFFFLKSGPQNVTVAASFCKLGWSADFTRCWKNRGFFLSS